MPEIFAVLGKLAPNYIIIQSAWWRISSRAECLHFLSFTSHHIDHF